MTEGTNLLFVGIDIEKSPWQISIYDAEGDCSSFQLVPKPQLLKGYLDAKFENTKVVCAYCSKRHTSWIHRLLTSYNYRCVAFDPQSARIRLGENMKFDSRTIADTLRKGLIKSVFPE